MRVGVAGCGHWGKNHVRNFQQLGALWAVVDPSEQGRALARSLAPQAKIFADYREFLKEDLNGIVLATPARSHASLATQALRAGKDVLVEKPLALTYAEGLKLCNLADELDRMMMVGHVLEYHPAFIALQHQVAAGRLGDMHYIYSNRLSLGQVRREENVLWSFAPHDIEMLLTITGQHPKRVLAMGSQMLQPGVDDLVQVRLEFPGRLQGHVFLSWINPIKEQRLVVIGNRGMAVFDGVNGSLTIQECGWSNSTGLTKGVIETVESSQVEPLQLECQAFLDSIGSRRPARTHARQSLAVVGVLEAAQASLQLGNWVPPLLD
ncbi:Gfo/Idh/MocA family oxidoreductase [bacterium]|nr:Gfo/Idh/MocA family oxidoreductase [bacterium]